MFKSSIILSFLILTVLSSSAVSGIQINVQNTNQVESNPEKVGDVQCVLCTYVVVYAEKLIMGNNTAADVINGLDQYCAMLPGTYSQTCHSFVRTYGALIIQNIINFETPSMICKQMMFCAAATTEVSEPQEPAVVQEMLQHHHHHKIEKKLECKACHYIASHAIKYVESGKTDDQIESALDSECNNFEIHAAVKVCKSVVHVAIKDLIRDLKNHVSAEDACKHVHMC
ncbi:hypothetical protein PPL_06545 [Heterostelium album PN500]|uniref:Saposin B-type domain-containing protein n=1 Tax=Heterostelium pallidum (strain ATCC 26659 / Pp 5 / PN500) TaxID=670386 RepID=D3BDG2_HETP5|nr:hypothetical protein PPL_06545 [Heterostelium album PN500]EFA80606.1 hypothetical protein PPL_06545 [Heterostelium album PN500]|eukprot:XP_020432726.1 hypothetical protein PPL_06545 [Heterostelium album PN500]